MTVNEKYVLECVKKWLLVKVDEELKKGLNTDLAKAHVYSNLVSDIDHSALLRRLICGFGPLAEAPELDGNGYPKYPDVQNLFEEPLCSPVWR